MTFSSVGPPLGISRTPSSSTVRHQPFLCSWSGRTRSSSSSRLLRQQNHGFRLQFIPHVSGNYLCIIGIAVHEVPVSLHAVFEASLGATPQPCSTPYTSSAVTVSTLTTGASDADLARDERASGTGLGPCVSNTTRKDDCTMCPQTSLLPFFARGGEGMRSGSHDLVNAPRRWYHRVATDHRNMGSGESLIELRLWTRNESGVIQALCLVYVDDFILACSDSPLGKRIFDGINNLYECGTWESRVFTQCGARITQAYDKHTKTWGGLEISFTEYVEEISLTNLPSHRRRDRKSQITPPELSQLRGLSGQLLWLSIQCLPQLLAPLSLLMGQTP